MDTACLYDTMILDLIPDGVVAVDSELKILRLNRAACRILNVSNAEAFLGQPVGFLMDEVCFLRLQEGEMTQFSDSVQPDGDSLRLTRSFSCNAERGVFVCVLHEEKPVSDEELEMHPGQQRAAELADAISEKQLQIVHEIAGLLGEAAVETQSMVRELKQVLRPGKEERHG